MKLMIGSYMYYFEMVSMFLLMCLFGALFLPFWGGCFLIMLIFMVIWFLIVFFSMNFFWFLAIGLFIYIYNFVRKYQKWLKLPDVSQYLASHPNCKLEVGISCCYCGSDKLINHGLLNKRSKHRFYVCSRCGSTLFRSTIL